MHWIVLWEILKYFEEILYNTHGYIFAGGLYQMISVWLFFFNVYHASDCQLWLVVRCWVGAYISQAF